VAAAPAHVDCGVAAVVVWTQTTRGGLIHRFTFVLICTLSQRSTPWKHALLRPTHTAMMAGQQPMP
jgi:hypothetical protein